MEWSTYLDHVAADAARISEAAALGLEPAVPCCPGWTVEDLIIHVGTVYADKATIVEEGWTERRDRPSPAPGGDLVDWFDDTAASLLTVLAAHDPAEPVWTWHSADQTVGFWYRRMAHETLIHRIDTDQSRGLVPEADDELAADGVDEVLSVMMSGAPSWSTLEPGDRVARLEIPGRSWTVRLGTFTGTSPNTGIEYVDEPTLQLVGAGARFQTVISGSAAVLDRWLWGRASLGDLTVQGDRAIAASVRAIARESTQ